MYSTYGRLFSSIIFSDHLDEKMLEERAKKLLSLDKKPNTEITLILNEKALPFGVYDLGDIVNASIKGGVINVFEKRRVVGWKVSLKDNNVEQVEIVTNARV